MSVLETKISSKKCHICGTHKLRTIQSLGFDEDKGKLYTWYYAYCRKCNRSSRISNTRSEALTHYLKFEFEVTNAKERLRISRSDSARILKLYSDYEKSQKLKKPRIVKMSSRKIQVSHSEYDGTKICAESCPFYSGMSCLSRSECTCSIGLGSYVKEVILKSGFSTNPYRYYLVPGPSCKPGCYRLTRVSSKEDKLDE